MNLLPQEEDDASFNTQSETNHVVNHPEFPESPDDARYLTTVMEDEDEEPLDDDDEDDVVSMPLFQYTRVMGSLPRASPVKTLAKRRYCSAMGKVILSSETMSNNNNNEETSDPSVPSPDLWHQHPIHVLAHGFEQGSLLVVDAVSGIAIADPFSVREGRNPHAVIAVSWDASGTYLAALDDGGMCAIFEIKYSIQMRDVTTSTPATGGNLLTHFMSALTRHPPTRDDGESRQRIPALTATSIQVQRIPYPSSFGKPTCVAIDPAYRKRREKSVMVGFADGRLVLTRRGFVFQRRTDAVIYQAVQDKDFAGIEAIAWRGPLVAWADSSGVRLLDVDVLQRIAHVDRPSGARSSLYPSVSRVHPSLCFETENDLLVAWGDCLLSLNIRNTDGRSSASVGDGSVVAQRRRVECKMAWELDCIACGVVPVDSRHVAVLGLVPASDDAEDEIESENRNGVELQVISRMDGAVVFADMIPLVRDEKQSHRQLESSMDFQLLSSFAVPRMDNTSEVQEMDNFGGSGANALDTLQGGMFGNGSNAGARFRDAHILWGLEHIVVEDEKILFEKDNTENKNGTADDESSVDSDEYDFALGNCSLESSSNINLSIPPIVALASSYDIVLARTRDADDAVSYALEKEKYALALHRALQHVRRLRRYNIDELVNQYFRALLRINDTADVSRLEDRSLSIRRLKIASRVMPILLGGKVDMWEHWLKELERIPGGLFIVRNAIPVRGMNYKGNEVSYCFLTNLTPRYLQTLNLHQKYTTA
ncbi:hypothetical protein FisN_14Lh199 [Fistulifera solaris]|uniref:Vps41 beta-propeller domain-containing protein n=1 Tax=Fistulifera solaris TaxID=1519565 RepID=A0A1Z5J9Q1_FISSO|nr:hypothetical protein FisN_14Lh199 [Fistulifera solaris]|eukprot:GAX10686.1 hypothetical protein FisN_14Lh199 [Fistulifera solaris]